MMNEKTEALIRTLKTEAVTVIHSAFEESPRKVALVDVDKSLSDMDKLEMAFMLTNSIDDAWWNNTEVTKMFNSEGCRSTSTGDFILVGDVKYKCEAAGWSKVQ